MQNAWYSSLSNGIFEEGLKSIGTMSSQEPPPQSMCSESDNRIISKKWMKIARVSILVAAD